MEKLWLRKPKIGVVDDDSKHQIASFITSIKRPTRLTLEVSVGTCLQAHRQVDDVEMGWRASETRVLAGSAARLAGLVTGPTDAALVREASWWTARDASAEREKTCG